MVMDYLLSSSDVYFVFRYESAEECADDDDEKLAISKLRKDVLDELKMHDSFVKVRLRFLYISLDLDISVYIFSSSKTGKIVLVTKLFLLGPGCWKKVNIKVLSYVILLL